MMDTGFAAGLIRERANPPSSQQSGGLYGRQIWAFDVWREGAHQPIIPLALWDAYKDRRMKQAGMAPRLRRPVHALSGLLRCGDCEAAMVVAYAGRKKTLSWTCHRSRDKRIHAPNYLTNERAEEAVLEWVVKNAAPASGVTDEARRLEIGRQARGEADRYEAEIDRLLARRSRLTDLYMDEVLTRAELLEKRDEIDEALRVAEEGRDAARAREQVSGLSVVRQFGVLADEWDRFTPADKREALGRVVKCIKIHPGEYCPGKVQPVPIWD